MAFISNQEVPNGQFEMQGCSSLYIYLMVNFLLCNQKIAYVLPFIFTNPQ